MRNNTSFASRIAYEEFGRRHYHPREWDRFIDRPPGHIGKFNSFDLRRVMDRNERLRRKLVAA